MGGVGEASWRGLRRELWKCEDAGESILGSWVPCKGPVVETRELTGGVSMEKQTGKALLLTFFFAKLEVGQSPHLLPLSS